MKSMEGCLLITDMDGTLLSRDKRISSQNKEAIERFVANGGRFTIATGRIAQSVQPYLDQLPVNAPAILYNGAVIHDFASGRNLWEKPLPASAVPIIGQFIDRFEGIGVEIYSEGAPYFVRENAVTKQHVTLEKFIRYPSGNWAELPHPWHKVLFAWEPDKLDEVERFAATLNADVTFVRSDAKYFEMLADGATKGHALEELAEWIGVPIGNSVALGDHLNDLEMLTRAGVGIAVANAVPALHQVAKRKGKHHEEHAIAEAIEWLEREWPHLR